MESIKIKNMFTLEETIAKELFEGVTYPWEVLPKIGNYIVELGKTLSEDKFDKIGDDVWIAKSANVFPSAYIHGPAIIDEEAEVRHCAFIRGNAIVGKGAVVGNSTELKNVVLFNQVQVPHYNYVGDSILGFKAHMGAGSITSNVKSDKTLVKVHGEEELETGLKKFGAMLGDNVVLKPCQGGRKRRGSGRRIFHAGRWKWSACGRQGIHRHRCVHLRGVDRRHVHPHRNRRPRRL